MHTQNASGGHPARLSTGISGLDDVLDGGFIPGRAYLVRGGPGSGKTTLGLHFLTAGTAQGEKVLFISLGEPEAQLRQNALRQAFDLSGVVVLDLSPRPEFFAETESYDLFSPAEVEREPTTRKIIEHFEQLRPARIFIDSMTQFRYLTTDAFQFRKQALSCLRFLVDRGATVLFTAEGTGEAPDDDLQFMSDGVISLESTAAARSLRVTKLRGSGFRDGPHCMRLGEWGMAVFPRLRPETFRREFRLETISSGIPGMDQMLSGGLERGTVTFITGPTGVGKTTLGLIFMKEAARRGERSVVYTFEENTDTLFERCEAINIPVRSMTERGTLSVMHVEPLQHTADEFAHMVRFQVEELNSRIVMIDSVAGYRLSLGGQDPVSYLHALSKYLSNMNVTTLLINEVEAITGDFRATELGISYLADNIVFLRYLEIDGELRKAVGVLKKRLSDFERVVRELEVTRDGVKIGEPFGLRGLLSGTPDTSAPRKH